MFKKFGIGMLAVLMAVAFSAFTRVKQPSNDFRNPSYYWYHVNLTTQKISQGETPFAYAEDVAGCDVESDEIDCKRGFLVQQNTSAGPISSRGDAVPKMTEAP